MSRSRIFTNEEMMVMLATIEIKYGYLSFETIHKAHLDNPFEIPSERTFRRAMGGLRIFTTPAFRDRLQPYLDNLTKK